MAVLESLKNIVHHAELYYWCLRANWLSLMAYPATFITMNLAGVIYSLGSVATVWVLFSQIHAIGQWTFPQVLLIYGLSIFSRSLFHLFWCALLSIQGMVRTGEIDRILVRPLNPLFQVIAGYLDNDDWGEFLTSMILIWTSLAMLGQRTFANAVWIVISGISGSVIFASIHLVANSVSFFTIESRGFSNLAWTLDEFTRYPADIYQRSIKTIITWVLPVSFASFYPAQLIFGRGQLVKLALLTPLVAGLTFTCAYGFWLFGLKSYQGVGN